MTDEQCRLQTVKAQEAVGTGRLVGALMSRARENERKGFSERGPSTAEAQSDSTEHMAGSARLPARPDTLWLLGRHINLLTYEP